MATVAETLELAIRVEQASGPHRELDWAIAEALGLVPEHRVIEIGWGYSWYRHPGDFYLARCPGSDQHADVEMWSPAKATASLDAAMTLEIADEYYPMFALERDLRDSSRWTARCDSHGDECGNGDSIIAEAATRELAVTAVWLRLRAALAQARGEQS